MSVAATEAPTGPRAGVDYPATSVEFSRWFPDDAACYAYLERLRWPDGITCPHCGERDRMWHVSLRQLRCLECRHELSVTKGTILEDTKLPLLMWFQAAWLVTNEKLGMSALSLQRALGLSRYDTSWLLLHKLRRAMVRPDRDQLSGVIEVDETYVGAPAPGKRGRGAGRKAIVAIAVEKRGTGKKSKRAASGRVRMQQIVDCTQASLTPFVESVAEPGSLIETDGWVGYHDLGNVGYLHFPTSISATGDPAHVVMPHVHRVASLLKRWILGTHQGGIKPRQLDAYLNEFVFRFNRRTSRSRGLLFYRLLEQAVQIEHITEREIIARRQPRRARQAGNSKPQQAFLPLLNDEDAIPF